MLQLTGDVTPDSPFGDRWQRAAALVGTSFNEQYGDADACHEALRLIRADELAQLQAGARCQLALVAISQDRPDEAADQLERAWELVAPLGGPVTVASVIEHTGRFTPRLDRARARALLERQLETAARSSRLLAAATAPRICEIHLAEGSALDAAEVAERWLEVARKAPDEPRAPVNREAILVDLLEQAARASLALGENGRAARAAAEARDLWADREGWMRAAELGNLVGQAHEYSDDAVAALDAYRQAAALADRVLEAGSFARSGRGGAQPARRRRGGARRRRAADGAGGVRRGGGRAGRPPGPGRPDRPRRRGVHWDRPRGAAARAHVGAPLPPAEPRQRAAPRGRPGRRGRARSRGSTPTSPPSTPWDDAVTTMHLRAGCLAQAGSGGRPARRSSGRRPRPRTTACATCGCASRRGGHAGSTTRARARRPRRSGSAGGRRPAG